MKHLLRFRCYRMALVLTMVVSALVSTRAIYAVGSADTITTVAGTGAYGYNGDGGPATAAWLADPFSVALDSAGNLYIADHDNFRVRKVDSAGTITTVAGTGVNGYGGDGGPATAARLSTPTGVAMDSAANLYIVDPGSARIRKVDSAGIITTVAGDGNCCYGGDGGPATAAQLNAPSGVAVDSAGNLYIADSFNFRVRKVDSAGIITTVAGNGSNSYGGDGGPATAAQLGEPSDVELDSAGNLYIADRTNSRIRKVDSAGIITTVAGGPIPGYSGDGGPAVNAGLLQPFSMAVDSAGNLYIADTSNNRIRKVDTAGTITTIAGDGVQGYCCDGGPAGNARLSVPKGVVVDAAGNLYIADDGNNRVRRIGPAPTNHPPVAADDSYSTNEDTPLTVAAPGVLANDTDADGNPLTAVLGSSPAHGTLTLNSDGSFTYTPTANYNGNDSFTYTIDDGHGGTATASVNITVTSVNDPPSFTKGPEPVTVLEDSGAYSASWATAISAGPADESGQTLTFQITNNANPGLFSAGPALAPNGTLSFTPASNANGSATVMVVLRDNGGTANGGVDSSSAQSFTITVTPVNDPPVANNDGATTRRNTAVTIAVLSNDTDVDGDTLHVVLVTSTSSKGGKLTTNGTTITYKPKSGFTGTDTFSYRASDGQATSNLATVTVTVTK